MQLWFLREHWMLVAAAIAALASMALVPPDEVYLTYFDWQTIGCLFCVLAVANAFRRIGTFDRIARTAVEHNRNPRTLALAIVLVTAAFSMAFTNDVALIIMLPLSATMLVKLDRISLVPIVFALQALSANLCGMITPFGNPQNLYLYSSYQLGLIEFLTTMALPFVSSAAGILAVTWFATGEKKWKAANEHTGIPGSEKGSKSRIENTSEGVNKSPSERIIETEIDPEGESESIIESEFDPEGGSESINESENAGTSSSISARPSAPKNQMPLDSRRLRLYAILFAITLLAVFRIIPFLIAVAIIAISLFISERKTLREVDYALLATFLCFFIFAGNVSRIPALGETLGSMMSQWGLLVSALTSQVISNVPAAVILSHFTSAWQPLLVGVNIGGAGTFVGSLASLIAIRYFGLSRKVFAPLREPDAPTMSQFLVKFGILNMAFFVALLGICQLTFG